MRGYGSDATETADRVVSNSVDQAYLNRRLEQVENFKPDQSSSGESSGLPDIQGFEQSEIASNEGVHRYLDGTFPPEHVDKACLQSVTYCDVYKPSGNGNILGMAEYHPGTDTSKIEVYRQHADGCCDNGKMVHTIAHEVGHNAYWVAGDATRQAWDMVSLTSAPDQYVTDYARTDIKEDFAESYAKYVLDPDLLNEVSPRKYDFMRNQIFHGREYR